MVTDQQVAALALEEAKKSFAVLSYEASPTQQEFHNSTVLNRLVTSGGRCLAGEQMIYDPMLRIERRVDSIPGPFHVLAWDGEKSVVAEAEMPFTKPAMDLYEITLSSGAVFRCTLTHQVLTSLGYFSIADYLLLYGASRPLSISGTSRSELLADARHCSQTREDSPVCYRPSRHLCDQLLQLVATGDQGLAPSQAGVPRYGQSASHGRDPLSVHADDPVHAPARSHIYRSGDHPSNSDDSFHQENYAHESPSGQIASPFFQPLSRDTQVALQSLSCASSLPALPVAPRDYSQSVCSRLAPPILEVVGVIKLRQDAVWDFTVPQWNNYIAAGIVHHNSGKSACCLAEVAMLMLGVHPTKPWFGPITVVCLCLSRQQASMTVQKKLFDQSELKGPCRDMPMLPESEIKEYGAVKHGFRFYYDATLRNGSKIHFAWADDEATWKRIQGMQADVVYIDENAGSERLIIELRKRLLDSQSAAEEDPARFWSGMLIWGATGTIINPTFEKFRDMCLSEFPDHKAFVIKPGETKVITQKTMDRFSATLTAAQREVHIDGTKTSADLVRIYGKQWNDKRHVLPTDYIPDQNDNLVLGYDPGVTHGTGMVIFAIRRQEPRRLYAVKCWLHELESHTYDIECLTSWLLGRKLRAVVYDPATKKRLKHAKTLLMTLIQDFATAGISPYDNNWFAGNNLHEPGIATVREYLDPDHYDKTVPAKLVLNPSVDSGCPMLRQQFLMYRGKESTKFTGQGGVVKKDDDLVDPTRYVCRQYFEWTPRYTCGPITMKADSPLILRPDRLEAQEAPLDDSPFARQCRMSKRRTPEIRAKELGKWGMSPLAKRMFI